MTRPAANAIRSLPRLGEVISRPYTLQEPFIEVARRFADQPGTVLMMSGGDHPSARYHILGISPWLEVRAQGRAIEFAHAQGTTDMEGDPLAALDEVLAANHFPEPSSEWPLRAGLLGYLAYDLKDHLEQLPRASVDDLGLPQLYLVAPSLLLIQDVCTGATTVHLAQTSDGPDAREQLAALDAALAEPAAATSGCDVGDFSSGFSREQYVAVVDRIRDYIRQGDVYQANMSQRFEASFAGDTFDLFEDMYAANPAPFFAYVNAGDHQIVSTSPERFIEQRGRHVETHPIKGTRPRGKTADEDRQLREELENSSKDDAELSMIVDLLRNDIGKVCRAGSVRVVQHRRIEAYQNVYHGVSVVDGVLDDDATTMDLVRATFPGGSITGCPKIRAMEIIDELEPVRRHLYTGSIGYLSFHDTMDLSIAIRTATIADDRVVFSVGGGIVYDSEPESEFEETLHKGQTIIETLRNKHSGPSAQPIAWCNGTYGPPESFSVPVDALGFQYGFGLFETLRVERGRPILLDEHLARFERSWPECFSVPPPDITWRDVIDTLIDRNALRDESAVVKILAAAGRPGGRRVFDGPLLVTARKHQPRLLRADQTGIALATYPHRRHTHLAGHKTMNYMFYKLAGDWAKTQGADEALILNGDGSVSETNTTNLFCVSGSTACFPTSSHALPGTMAAAVQDLLASWGMQIEQRPCSVEELGQAAHVFVTNSVIGVMPVQSIDKRTWPVDDELCRRLGAAVFEGN